MERLRAEHRPIIFVTPHLGGYDVAGRYLWSQLPILAMYRPHKIGWLDELIREGRNRGAAFDGTNVAPATMAGVRMLLKHLKRGGCSVVLPDQVPGEGEGEWVEFFGRPAYTMTLLGPAAGGLRRRPRLLLRRAPGARRGLSPALRRARPSRWTATAPPPRAR